MPNDQPESIGFFLFALIYFLRRKNHCHKQLQHIVLVRILKWYQIKDTIFLERMPKVEPQAGMARGRANHRLHIGRAGAVAHPGFG